MSRPLSSRGMIPRYPLIRKLSGPQSRSGRCGTETNLLPVPGIKSRPSSTDWTSPPVYAFYVTCRNPRLIFSSQQVSQSKYYMQFYICSCASHDPLVSFLTSSELKNTNRETHVVHFLVRIVQSTLLPNTFNSASTLKIKAAGGSSETW
jgi:hypothetical protein